MLHWILTDAGINGNEITDNLAMKGTEVHLEPLDVNSVMKLIIYQIHEICRKVVAEQEKKEKFVNNGKSIKKNPAKEAVATFRLTFSHNCLATYLAQRSTSQMNAPFAMS